jgi:hypothetical protein
VFALPAASRLASGGRAADGSTVGQEGRFDKSSAVGDLYKKLLLLMELSATPPGLGFFAVLEIRGLDLVEAARSRPN